jgi:hypothetical protein
LFVGSEPTFSSYVLSCMVIFGFEILFSFVIVATCIGLMFHQLQWWWDMWILSGWGLEEQIRRGNWYQFTRRGGGGGLLGVEEYILS